MTENYPEEVRPLPRIRLSPAPPKRIECLEPSEVRALLDWLKEHCPPLWGMGVLQALCGLRVLEAAAVRRQDIDFTRGTVTVTETPIHKPKTSTSYRTVPICREGLETLSTLVREQSIIPHSGEIFLSPRGGLWNKNALCQRWKRFLPMAAAETKMFRIKEIPAHRLRSSFATMASRLGVEDRVLKSYLGHAPTDILGAHYRRISDLDLGSVSSRMNEWRSLPDSDQEWQDRGNIEKEGSVTG